MPQQLSAIDNAGSNFCVLSSKGSKGHLLYSMDVVPNRNRLAMKRQRKILWKTKIRSGRIAMFGGFLILTVVIVILMNLSNDYQQAQIHSSYCGDFGFGGKYLTLMKDNTFRFDYYGCSQTNGYVSGRWTADESIITFIPAQPDSNLDSDYRMTENRLLPMNLTDDEGFTYCAEYLDAWERAAEEK